MIHNLESYYSSRAAARANLVQEIMDLLELLLGQFARIHAFDLSPKVFELLSVGSRGKGNGRKFDGHDAMSNCAGLVRDGGGRRAR